MTNTNEVALPAASGTGDEPWGLMVWLSCELSLDLPVPQFKVRDLLHLAPGRVIDTKWGQSRDIPLRVNGKLLALSEFEVIDGKLAVRLTELV